MTTLKPAQVDHWTCFHCGETFHDLRAASMHFGVDEEQQPACQIKGSDGGLLRALRETEDALFKATAALHAESADGLKAYRANLSRHATALRSAEEIGYERGLADGRLAMIDAAIERVRSLVGDCGRVEGCVCGGDMARVRAGCTYYRKSPAILVLEAMKGEG